MPRELRRQEGGADGDRIADQEEDHVPAQHPHVDAHLRSPAVRARAKEHDCHAGHEHGQRREHEGRAQDGAHADRMRGLGDPPPTDRRPDDGDDRDQRLGHRRRHRGQHAADRPLGQVQPMPEPLDAVGEQLGGEQDDRQRADQEDDVHPSGRWGYGRRCWGAYGSRATCRARLRATVSMRWWRAQVPVLRRGSIFARSDRYRRRRLTSL